MNNKTIEVIIGSGGEIQIDAVGFKGPDCERANPIPGKSIGGGESENQEARISPIIPENQSTEDWRMNKTRKPKTTTRPKIPVVYGEYGRNGYEVWIGDQLAYAGGNHKQDSIQPARCRELCEPLRRLRQFCIKTTREIAGEGGYFGGVERVPEDEG